MPSRGSTATPAKGRRRTLAIKMWLPTLAAVALAGSYASVEVEAVEILFRNSCQGPMVLYDGNTTEKIKQGGFTKHKLEPGAIRAYRYSKSNQATLAEFSVQESTTWYDIGIIPTGTMQGPGLCGSLEECKAATGGTGFNVPIKIVPGDSEDPSVGDYCRTLNCFADGCEDAYQFPHDKDKTHNCPSDVHFTVVFCASPSTGSTDGSLGWPSLESGEIDNKDLGNFAVPSSTPSPSTDVASTSKGSGDDDGTSVAVIIAAILGGLVMVFAAVVVVRRLRYYRYELMNKRRYSSEALVFVEAKDENML